MTNFQATQKGSYADKSMTNITENNLSTRGKIIVFTGGGTGGHVYPNIALKHAFEQRGFNAVYIGAEGEAIEKRLSEQNNIPYYAVPTIKLVRSFSVEAIKNNLAIAHTLRLAVNKAVEVLDKIKPNCVFSKGGFVSLPVVLGAKRLGIPVFAHESDLTLGLANKIAELTGATMLKANPNSRFKGVCVGMPLREELFSASKRDAVVKLGIDNPQKKSVLLVLGGSSGAAAINDAVKKNIDELCENFFVLHVCGKNKREKIEHENYVGFEYADDVASFYAASDLVLSRAGATAVFEISALKKRAVFVPLPKGASRGDQIYNAELAEQYGATVLRQDSSFSNRLVPSLKNALQNPPMRPLVYDSNGKIADLICDTLRRGEKCKDKKPSPNGSR